MDDYKTGPVPIRKGNRKRDLHLIAIEGDFPVGNNFSLFAS